MSSSRPNGRPQNLTPYETALHDVREVAFLEIAGQTDTEARYRKFIAAAAQVALGMADRLEQQGVDVDAVEREVFGRDVQAEAEDA